ncbi:hypothetical protein TB1_010005 [Malus domestica]
MFSSHEKYLQNLPFHLLPHNWASAWAGLNIFKHLLPYIFTIVWSMDGQATTEGEEVVTKSHYFKKFRLTPSRFLSGF